MLTHLRIQNFKGWKDTGKLRLAPITVFFGTNSSGKSSIGQFLMMLKQTAASNDRSRVLHPGDKETAVDLGSLSDIIHERDPKRDISFSFGASEFNTLDIEDILSGKKYRGDQLDFSARVGFEEKKGLRAKLQDFEYTLKNSKTESEELRIRLERNDKNEFKLTTTGFNAVRNLGRAWPLSVPGHFYSFPDEFTAYYQNTSGLARMSLTLQKLLENISYLGPLREEPERFYQWAGENPDSVGDRGKQWLSAFLAASERNISRGYKRKAQPFETVIAGWLKDLGLIHSFSVKPMAKGLREYRVGIKLSAQSPEVSIPDVGFGVGQVLPVLVQSFYAKAKSTVIIEQPELHLHPAVQKNLADMFISASQARENGEDRKVQFLIESHSEHFLHRLQRRIAEETISPDDVAIYFCDRKGSESDICQLEINEYGGITNWPKDFFGDQIADLAEIQKATIQRKRAKIQI